MTPIEDVPAGTLIFLACGCAGIRGVSVPAGPVPVVVNRSCRVHTSDAPHEPRLLALGRSEFVSMFTRPGV